VRILQNLFTHLQRKLDDVCAVQRGSPLKAEEAEYALAERARHGAIGQLLMAAGYSMHKVETASWRLASRPPAHLMDFLDPVVAVFSCFGVFQV